jgi:methionyl-tRNA formyltransferase
LLRLGILLDDLNIPIWIEELLQWIEAQQGIDLRFVVVNKSVQASGRSSFMYRLLRRLDQKLLQLPNDPSKRVQWEPKGMEVIHVEPIRKKFSDYFPEDALNSIKAYQPDLLIRFGFRILRGKILSVAPYGILSLHHGDTAAYRGGPPAFWEVVR